MHAVPSNSTGSPEPLHLLLDSLPSKALLRFIKQHAQLAQVVFLGFTPREKTLGLPIVLQRVFNELTRQPQFIEELAALWLDVFASLMRQLNAPGFSPTPQQCAAMQKKYGDAALRYGLLHAEREEIRTLVEQLPSAAPGTMPVPAPAASVPEKSAAGQQRDDLRPRLQEMEAERQALKSEIARLEQQLSERTDRMAALQKQAEDAVQRLDREQRRVKKAEEEVASLRKAAKRPPAPAVAEATPAPAPAPAIPPELLDSVAQAIAILQRGLSTTAVTPAAEAAVAPPAERPSKPPLVPKTTARVGTDATITLPFHRGKRSYAIGNIIAALHRNDGALLEQIRNGIALLADQPLRERAIIAELMKAGIPDAILRGPLRPVVVDGSNVANINPETPRARMDYLLQVRRSAWREGYFPVTIIVDASLRHQIDRMDLLMEMVERGEIIMAQAGTSADELLIEEARRQHAIIITNDRMTDWPTARELDKRHVELSGGIAVVGPFQRSNSNWFY